MLILSCLIDASFSLARHPSRVIWGLTSLNQDFYGLKSGLVVLTTMKNPFCRQYCTVLSRSFLQIRSTIPRCAGNMGHWWLAAHWELPSAAGELPAELQPVTGWCRDAKPAFNWGQICSVIPAPELPVELAWASEGLDFVLPNAASLTSL